MKWGLLYWPYWMIMMSTTFVIPEIIALVTNPANTLSDYSWGELHVYAGEHLFLHSLAWWTSLLVTVLAMVVLVFHIWFKRFV